MLGCRCQRAPVHARSISAPSNPMLLRSGSLAPHAPVARRTIGTGTEGVASHLSGLTHAGHRGSAIKKPHPRGAGGAFWNARRSGTRANARGLPDALHRTFVSNGSGRIAAPRCVLLPAGLSRVDGLRARSRSCTRARSLSAGRYTAARAQSERGRGASAAADRHLIRPAKSVHRLDECEPPHVLHRVRTPPGHAGNRTKQKSASPIRAELCSSLCARPVNRELRSGRLEPGRDSLVARRG